jgi:hypothetical protein
MKKQAVGGIDATFAGTRPVAITALSELDSAGERQKGKTKFAGKSRDVDEKKGSAKRA